MENRLQHTCTFHILEAVEIMKIVNSHKYFDIPNYHINSYKILITQSL